MGKNTIVLHACGGCGIQLSHSVFETIANLGEGFSNIKTLYIDTSTSNYDKIQPKSDLFLIKTKDLGKGEIRGSGSERQTNAKDIIPNVREYLDKNNIKEHKIDEYHVVAFSGSGGSGNVIATIIIDLLLKKNIPVVALVVGDSQNGMSAINTLNTLSTLNGVAMRNNKPLVISYVNNHQYFKNNMLKAQKDADDVISSNMTMLSLFLSGEHGDLDNQDMINIIDQSNYKTIQIPAGLYGLHFFSGDVTTPNGTIPTVGRTLAMDDQDFDTKLQLLNHKKGVIDSNNVVNLLGNQLPIHMVVYANFFKIEESYLKPITDEYYSILDGIKIADVNGSSRSNLDEETGFVF